MKHRTRWAVVLAVVAVLALAWALRPSPGWTVADGPWEDGSILLEAPSGDRLPACLADAICEEGTP